MTAKIYGTDALYRRLRQIRGSNHDVLVANMDVIGRKVSSHTFGRNDHVQYWAAADETPDAIKARLQDHEHGWKPCGVLDDEGILWDTLK